MLSYHLGAAQTLLRARCISRQTQLAGASGGALVAAAVACELPPRNCLSALAILGAELRATVSDSGCDNRSDDVVVSEGEIVRRGSVSDSVSDSVSSSDSDSGSGSISGSGSGSGSISGSGGSDKWRSKNDIMETVAIFGSVEQPLRRALNDLLPADAALRCSNRVAVAVTDLEPRLGVRLVREFSSREDLIEALVASSHVPGYLDGKFARTFRGRRVIDGGILELYPRISGHLAVCPYPFYGDLLGLPVDIGPMNDTPLWRLTYDSFIPAGADAIDTQFAAGERAAKRWLDKQWPRLPLFADVPESAWFT
eukprot:UC1_evm1s571